MKSTTQIDAKDQRQIGTLTIALSDKSFLAGYDIGYRQFQDLYQGSTLADFDLLHILLNNLAGIAHTCTYKIGVVAGWYAALYGYDREQAGGPL